jgi:hypothetical protein
MKNTSKALLVLGFLLLAYAIFSRFYGEPSIAMMRFRSLSLLILANMAFILSLIVEQVKK